MQVTYCFLLIIVHDFEDFSGEDRVGIFSSNFFLSSRQPVFFFERLVVSTRYLSCASGHFASHSVAFLWAAPERGVRRQETADYVNAYINRPGDCGFLTALFGLGLATYGLQLDRLVSSPCELSDTCNCNQNAEYSPYDKNQFVSSLGLAPSYW